MGFLFFPMMSMGLHLAALRAAGRSSTINKFNLAMVSLGRLSSCPIRDGLGHSNQLSIIFGGTKLGIAFPCTVKTLISKQQPRAVKLLRHIFPRTSAQNSQVRLKVCHLIDSYVLKLPSSKRNLGRNSQIACQMFCEMHCNRALLYQFKQQSSNRSMQARCSVPMHLRTTAENYKHFKSHAVEPL